jgi:membrane-associated protein
VAVFLGRFIAFFRAAADTGRNVPDALPTSPGVQRRGRHRVGIGFVLLGCLAGNSCQQVEETVGPGSTIAVALLGIVIWRIHKHHAEAHDSDTSS